MGYFKLNIKNPATAGFCFAPKTATLVLDSTGLLMYKTLILLVVLFWFAPSASFSANIPRNGTEEIFNREAFAFKNKNCVKNGTCDLKEFRLAVKKSRIWVIDGWHYGSSVIASYKTNIADNLEKYSFVQFIRGCVFDAYFTEDRNIKKELGHSKPHFSEFDEYGQPIDFKTFCFSDWVIDSIDKDPAYGSFPGHGRFYAVHQNIMPPQAYVRDRPYRAFAGKTYAVNVSMEFKTCLYKTKDVPLETTEDNVNFAMPIKCFEWQNIYIYNHEIKEFEMKFEIDEFCLESPKKS